MFGNCAIRSATGSCSYWRLKAKKPAAEQTQARPRCDVGTSTTIDPPLITTLLMKVAAPNQESLKICRFVSRMSRVDSSSANRQSTPVVGDPVIYAYAAANYPCRGLLCCFLRY